MAMDAGGGAGNKVENARATMGAYPVKVYIYIYIYMGVFYRYTY